MAKKENIIFTFLLSYFAFLQFFSPKCCHSSLGLPICQSPSISIQRKSTNFISLWVTYWQTVRTTNSFTIVSPKNICPIVAAHTSRTYWLVALCFQTFAVDEKQLTVRRSWHCQEATEESAKRRKTTIVSKSVGQTRRRLLNCLLIRFGMVARRRFFHVKSWEREVLEKIGVAMEIEFKNAFGAI